jgi:hypothetical protein
MILNGLLMVICCYAVVCLGSCMVTTCLRVVSGCGRVVAACLCMVACRCIMVTFRTGMVLTCQNVVSIGTLH